MKLNDYINNNPVRDPEDSSVSLGDYAKTNPVEVSEEFNMSELLEIPDEMYDEWKKMGKKGWFETAREQSLMKYVPVLGTAKSVFDSVRTLDAMKRIQTDFDYSNNPKLRNEDVRIAREYLWSVEESRVRERTLLGKIAAGVSEVPAFAMEFMMTGGVAKMASAGARGAVRGAVKKTLGSAAEKAARKGLSNLAIRGVGVSSGALARTIANPVRLSKGYLDRRLESNLGLTDKGLKLLDSSAEKPMTTFFKSLGDAWIENVSEVSGKGFAIVGRKFVRQKFVNSMFKLYRRIHPNKSVKNILRKTGWDGFIEEIGEERLGGLMRALTGVENFGAENPDSVIDRVAASFPNAEEFMVEAGVLGFPLAPGKAMSVLVNRRLLENAREVNSEHDTRDVNEITEQQASEILGIEPTEAEMVAGEVELDQAQIESLSLSEVEQEAFHQKGELAEQRKEEKRLDKETAVKDLMTALKEAKPARKAQEESYTRERADRIQRAREEAGDLIGEERFIAELRALKGEMTKQDFDALSQTLTQEHINLLYQTIDESPNLSQFFFQRITAKRGLQKIFEGQIPNKSEIKLLEGVFGAEFVEQILNKREVLAKFSDLLVNAVNFPKAMMASYDMSAPLRQGGFFVGRPQFYKSFEGMFRVVGSEKAFNALGSEISSRPTYEFMDRYGLGLTSLGSQLMDREEAFMSNFAEKIPLFGVGIKASERAYVGFLNKLRADVFDDFFYKAKELDLEPESNPELLKSIVKYVNSATGRGSVKFLESSIKALSIAFFSPRLIFSRLNLMNPMFYANLHPLVRKEALKDLLTFVAVQSSVLSLAALAGGSIGTDPRSSDFLKIKIGNTRIDTMAGFQQYTRMVGQLITGEYVSSVTGKVIKLGEGYKPITRASILGRQVEGKLSPGVSFLWTILKQQDWRGKPVDIKKEAAQRMVPLLLQEAYDTIKEDPRLTPLLVPAFFGSGVQTYGKIEKKKSPSKTSLKERKKNIKARLKRRK